LEVRVRCLRRASQEVLPQAEEDCPFRKQLDLKIEAGIIFCASNIFVIRDICGNVSLKMQTEASK